MFKKLSYKFVYIFKLFGAMMMSLLWPFSDDDNDGEEKIIRAEIWLKSEDELYEYVEDFLKQEPSDVKRYEKKLKTILKELPEDSEFLSLKQEINKKLEEINREINVVENETDEKKAIVNYQFVDSKDVVDEIETKEVIKESQTIDQEAVTLEANNIEEFSEDTVDSLSDKFSFDEVVVDASFDSEQIQSIEDDLDDFEKKVEGFFDDDLIENKLEENSDFSDKVIMPVVFPIDLFTKIENEKGGKFKNTNDDKASNLKNIKIEKEFVDTVALSPEKNIKLVQNDFKKATDVKKEFKSNEFQKTLNEAIIISKELNTDVDSKKVIKKSSSKIRTVNSLLSRKYVPTAPIFGFRLFKNSVIRSLFRMFVFSHRLTDSINSLTNSYTGYRKISFLSLISTKRRIRELARVTLNNIRDIQKLRFLIKKEYKDNFDNLEVLMVLDKLDDMEQYLILKYEKVFSLEKPKVLRKKFFNKKHSF